MFESVIVFELITPLRPSNMISFGFFFFLLFLKLILKLTFKLVGFIIAFSYAYVIGLL